MVKKLINKLIGGEIMVEKNPLIIGTVFTLASYIILSTAQQGGINGLIVFLLGGILLGFLIAQKKDSSLNIKNLAINGVILGIITGILSITVLLVEMDSMGIGYQIDGTIVVPIIILFISYVIAAIAGVIIGNYSRVEFLNNLSLEQ